MVLTVTLLGKGLNVATIRTMTPAAKVDATSVRSHPEPPVPKPIDWTSEAEQPPTRRSALRANAVSRRRETRNVTGHTPFAAKAGMVRVSVEDVNG